MVFCAWEIQEDRRSLPLWRIRGDFSRVENILVRLWQLGRGKKKKKTLGSRMVCNFPSMLDIVRALEP